MEIGLTLPVMEPDLWGDGPEVLEAWSRAIDAGPFASVCFGERMAFDNPETLTLLGAVAAWTSRVRIATTVIVPQFHDPVLLAKSLATADQLSRGRLSVALGVGGREEDYRAAGVDLSTRTMAQLADRVDLMRRVWDGEKVVDAVRPVGPAPHQPGGPELLVGTLGTQDDPARRHLGRRPGRSHPRPRRHRGRCVVRPHPSRLGRGRPSRATTDHLLLGRPGRRRRRGRPAGPRPDPPPPAALHELVPVGWVDAMAPTTGFAGTPAQLRTLLDRLADVGAHEVQLIPTSSDVRQVEEIAAVVG